MRRAACAAAIAGALTRINRIYTTIEVGNVLGLVARSYHVPSLVVGRSVVEEVADNEEIFPRASVYRMLRGEAIQLDAVIW